MSYITNEEILEKQQIVPREDLFICQEFIDEATWKFAKTYAETSPHEYTSKAKEGKMLDHYLVLAKCIKLYGFTQKGWSYLIIDNF